MSLSPYLMRFDDLTYTPSGRCGYEVEAITWDEFDRTLVVKAEVSCGSRGDRWTPGESPAIGITEVSYRRERDKKEFPLPAKAWPKAFGTGVHFAEVALLDAFEKYAAEDASEY